MEPTALMKSLIDRFVYFNCPENRTKIKGKGAVITVPFEEENPDTVAPVLTFFNKCFQYLEMKFIGKIIAPGITLKGEVLKKDNFITEALNLGKLLTL